MFLDSSYLLNQEKLEGIEKDITCPICQGIINDPYFCNKCQNNFCNKCIKKWQLNNLKCPFRCEYAGYTKNLFFTKIFSELLKFRCQKGCEKIISYKDINNHLEKCKNEDFKEKYYTCATQLEIYKVLVENLDDIKNELEESKERNQELENELEELKQRNNELENELDEVKDDRYNFENKNNQLNDEIDILEKELKNDKEKIKGLENELNVIRDDKNNFEKKNDELTEKIEELEKELGNCMEKINELESQLNGVSNNNILKGQFEKEQENNNELQKKIESLGKQIIIDKKSKDNDSKISNQPNDTKNDSSKSKYNIRYGKIFSIKNK